LLVDICTKYSLPDFDIALSSFINYSFQSTGEGTLWDGRHRHFSTWNKFQLQLHSSFQPQIIMPSRVIQAYSPYDTFPFSNCNTVLIDTMGDDSQIGTYFVVPISCADFITLFRELCHTGLTSFPTNDSTRFQSAPSHIPLCSTSLPLLMNNPNL
jgi:hypothetical protein